LRDSSEEMRREHQALVAALENGDQVAARQAITEQILSSRERILEAILQGDFDSIQIG
jgi:DNA-binding GntR family transcriptional regulator